MKKVLITGVSRGLGNALKASLLSNGFHVYGTARSLSGLEDSEKLRHIQLDLCDKNSIQSAVSHIYKDTNKLDAIIHNAGIAYLNPSDEMTDEERRHTFEVNFFGPVFLTEQILPQLRSSNSGKIIIISSIASLDPWPSLGVYSASKAAFERVAFEWAVLLKKWNIDVSIIRPNPLPTNMQILKSANTGSGIYGSVFCNELFWEKIEDVCDTVVGILKSDSPHFEYESGRLSKKIVDSILKENVYQKLIKEYREKQNSHNILAEQRT